MSSYQHLINFIDELMNLMEHHKRIYKKLITYRHQIRNVIPASMIEESINLVRHQLQQRDFSFLSLDVQHDVQTILSTCNPTNQTIIWKWIDLF